MATKTKLRSRFTYGACYYPEHWDASEIDVDLPRMRACGFDIVRIGEGAWGYFEPEEGKFQFDLFDRVLDRCAHHGMEVIFGTPTYTGPAWISHEYPEVLRWNFNPQPMGHGSRRNYTYSSQKYLDLCDRIVAVLAERYKEHPAIVG